MSDCINKIGERLRTLRIKKGLTQKAAAEKIGIHEKSYNVYEVGRRKKSNRRGESTRPEKEPVDISNDHLIALADSYNVSVDYILGRTDYETINGEDIAKLTGLSDHAIKVLQLCAGDNPMMYHVARDVSGLLIDWEKNGANSLLSTITKYIQCAPGMNARITPETGSAFSTLGAVEMDMNAALLYGIVAAAERYKADFQKEINSTGTD